MIPSTKSAAERLVELPVFRWTAGMLDTNGNRVIGSREDAVMDFPYETLTLCTGYHSQRVRLSVPDLSDPATIACVLELARYRDWET